MVRTAAMIFVFFIVGLALGFVVGHWSGEPAVSVPAGESDDDGARRVAGGGPAPSQTPRPAPAASKPDRPDRTPEGGSSVLRDALEEISPPVVQQGRGRFTGHVRTKAGEPLAGVRVRAEASSAFRPDADPDAASSGDVERIAVEAVKSFHWRRASTRETRTDASGAYAIDGLVADWRYDVRADADGWRIDTAPGHHRHDELPGSTIDFLAVAVVDLHVAVRHQDGTEAFAAYVHTTRGDNQGRHRWSPRSPRISIEPGSYRMRAVAGDEGELASSWVDVTLAPGVEPDPLTLVLDPRPGIAGRVIFPAGQGSNHAVVRVLRFTGQEPPTEARLLQDGQNQWASESSGYRFTFNDLESGRYLVGAGRDWQALVVTAIVEVGDGLVSIDLEVPPLDPGRYVVLRVLGPDGEALDDLSISTRYVTGTGSHGRGATMLKQDDGSVWVLHEPPDDVADQKDLRSFLSVQSKQYGQKEVEYDPESAEEVVVEFAEPATVEVTVLGYAASGLEDRVSVHLVDRQQTEDGGVRSQTVAQSREGSLDAAGRQTIGPVEPGEYILALQLSSGRHRHRTIAELPVVLESGPNAASITMPRLHNLVVAFEETSGVRVNLQMTSTRTGFSTFESATVDETGRVVFDGLPPGEYRVRAWGGSVQGEMVVQVPAAGEVPFEPTQFNALRITVTDPDGYLARVGFRDGDLAIGLEGVEFENTQQMQLLAATAMVKPEVKFMVARGRQRLTITIETAKMRDPRSLGGNLEQATR